MRPLFLGSLFLVAAIPALAKNDELLKFTHHPLDRIGTETLYEAKETARLYQERDGAVIWTGQSGHLTEAGKYLLQRIETVSQDGLSARSYHLDEIERRLQNSKAEDSTRLNSVDILLTDAFLSMAHDLSAGKVDPSAAYPNWAIGRRQNSLRVRLENAVATDRVELLLNDLTPRDEGYGRLKSALAAYRDIEKLGPLPIVSEGPRLRRGDRGQRVVQLRERLAREGIVSRPTFTSDRFDESLEKKVIAFQRSHGLQPDGTLGKETIAELNVPLSLRIRQIVVNLERQRWFPPSPGLRYLFVDITSFRVVVFDSGKAAFSMRIIVGDDHQETPTFRASLRSVVLNPSWLLPQRIVENEILPRLKVSPTFARRKGIRIYALRSAIKREIDPTEVDWSQVDAASLPYLFEQPPGPQNPLGQIKFLLTNAFAIYLHGTPETDLFERARRTLSHGCIRVENPLALASFLLKDNARTWSEANLLSAIRTRASQSIPLASPVPVYLWYRTAWVDESNRLQFRRDIYRWDERLWDALNRRRLFSQLDPTYFY